jgi:hypothetical protein
VSWEQLLSIREDLIEAYRHDQAPPQACPNDGEPLVSGPDGVLFCHFDGWRNE